MQANWSIILNVLLLIGVIVAIGSLMKVRRQGSSAKKNQPNLEHETKACEPSAASVSSKYMDDIIAVRKVSTNSALETKVINKNTTVAKKAAGPQLITEPLDKTEVSSQEYSIKPPKMIMMFLSAKEHQPFVGYDLLHTLLAAGLRFGEGNIFHRYQAINGQGPVLCSVAAATEHGTFDLQNIGVFSARGLCLYMYTSDNALINGERFAGMLKTARILSEQLDAHILDEEKKPLTSERINHYQYLLGINHINLEQFT